ncbi:hypothetical protein [Cetobacterium somerae]
MYKFLSILFLFTGFHITYPCDDIEVHKKVIEYIFEHEGEKVLKTKSEYSKFGIRNSLLKNYNKKYKLNYTIRTLNKEKANEVALDLMKEYKIIGVKECNLKLVVYDLFYNAGPKVGTLISQRTLNKYFNNQIELEEDGIMGEKTIEYLNKVIDLKVFTKIFIEERLKYYSKLKNWEKYKNGWTKRINSFSEIKELECKVN